jgi:N-acyl-D-amino-acid deacylase
MTGRTADVFGLEGRGTLKEGGFADLVMFDAATVKDRATFTEPRQVADGILETWVNGQSVYTYEGGASDTPAGRLLQRAA